MIVFALVLLGWVGLIVAAWRLHRAIDRASAYFRVLTGGYRDAEVLAAARARFRRRQQRVEQAVATGTTGIEAAHATLAQRLGAKSGGADIYAGIRAINRGLGRSLSAMLAPKPRAHNHRLVKRPQREAKPKRRGGDE